MKHYVNASMVDAVSAWLTIWTKWNETFAQIVSHLPRWQDREQDVERNPFRIYNDHDMIIVQSEAMADAVSAWLELHARDKDEDWDIKVTVIPVGNATRWYVRAA